MIRYYDWYRQNALENSIAHQSKIFLATARGSLASLCFDVYSANPGKRAKYFVFVIGEFDD